MRLAMTLQRAASMLREKVWVPAFAGNTEVRKQGPHPTLSHRERAKNDEISPRPLGGEGWVRGLDPERSGIDLVIELGRDRHIAFAGLLKEQRLGDLGGVEALLDQVQLAIFEGAGGFDLGG